MKNKLTLSLLCAILTGATAVAQNGHDLFQKALRKERVEGDLKGAIELYQQIVKEHAANRGLAAQALVQMGRGYETLGAAEARRAYEKVISEYADQAKEVAEAKARLTVLDKEAPMNRANGQPLVQLVASDKIDRWVAYGDAKPSPNGKYLAYVNWEHGNLAFYNIETGELRDLTTEGTWAAQTSSVRRESGRRRAHKSPTCGTWATRASCESLIAPAANPRPWCRSNSGRSPGRGTASTFSLSGHIGRRGRIRARKLTAFCWWMRPQERQAW
jgi:hypothetical protein